MDVENPQGTSTERSSREEDQSPSPKDVQAGADEEDLKALLKDLRAEVTRLKAQRAKRHAQNWIERYPILSVTLSTGLGAAVGYGIAYATRPAPPTLSEQAQRRIRRLLDEAGRFASDVGRDLSDRAAQSGAEVRTRAEEAGRRFATRASERARQAGTEATTSLQQVAEEATKRVQEGQQTAAQRARELGERVSKEASRAAEETADTVRERVSATDGKHTVKRSLLTIAGLAAGSYLASKARQWL